MYVCKKQIHQDAFLNSNRHFQTRYKSIIHNNAPSSEKVHPVLSSHIKIHQHICLELTLSVCKWWWSVHISLLIQPRQLENAILCIEDSYFSLKQQFEVKMSWWICLTSIFSPHKMLIDGLESCGLLWRFYQLFGLSFWRHPFRGANDVRLNFSKPFLMRKQTHLHLG